MTNTLQNYQNQKLSLHVNLEYTSTIDQLSITEVIQDQSQHSGPLNSYCSLCLIGTNLIVGFFYRFLLLKKVWRMGGVLERPINLLTVLDEGTKLFACSCWLLGYAAAIFIDDPLYIYTGKSFCNVVDFISGLAAIQNWYGGVGIALMRAIYIHFSTRMKFPESKVAILIGVTSINSST